MGGSGYSIYDVDGYGDAAKDVKTPIEPDDYLQDVFFQTRPEVIDFDKKNPSDRNPYYQVRDDFEIQDQIKDEFQYNHSPENWDKQEPQFVKPKNRPQNKLKSNLQNVINLYNFEKNSLTLSLDEFLPLHGIRTAKTFNDLLRATRYFKIKERGKRCQVKMTRSDLKLKYWEFRVKGNEVWSSPQPHLVQIHLLPNPRTKDIRQLHVKVTCDCEYWQYYGPDFNAHTQKYLLDRPKSDGSPPDVRDPNRQHLICKHVWAIGQVLLQYAHKNKLDTFEEVDSILDTLSKKKITEMPKALREISENLEGTEQKKLEPIINKIETELEKSKPVNINQLNNQVTEILKDDLSKNEIKEILEKETAEVPIALKEVSEKVDDLKRKKLEPIIKKMETSLEKGQSSPKLKQLNTQAINTLETVLNKKDKGFLSNLLDSILKFLGINKKTSLDRKPLVANVLEIYTKENLETGYEI